MLLLAQPFLDASPTPESSHPKTLGILLVGDNPASELYVSIKQREAAKYGVRTQLLRLPQTATPEEVRAAVHDMNTHSDIDGLIVQLPLPEHITTDAVLDAIDPRKDVDNLTGKGVFVSPMVQSVQALITHYKIQLSGKKLCVIGRGRLVGAPLATWLISLGHQPEIVDADTPNKDDIIRSADVIFAGAGHKYVVHAGNACPGQTIIDCSGKDVDFEALKDKVAAITPSKGGIGPLTVHFLLTNVLQA